MVVLTSMISLAWSTTNHYCLILETLLSPIYVMLLSMEWSLELVQMKSLVLDLLWYFSAAIEPRQSFNMHLMCHITSKNLETVVADLGLSNHDESTMTIRTSIFSKITLA